MALSRLPADVARCLGATCQAERVGCRRFEDRPTPCDPTYARTVWVSTAGRPVWRRPLPVRGGSLITRFYPPLDLGFAPGLRPTQVRVFFHLISGNHTMSHPPKDHEIKIWCTAATYLSVNAAAEAEDRSVSSYLRSLIHHDLERRACLDHCSRASAAAGAGRVESGQKES